MSTKNQTNKLELAYTIFCDDVRLEVGNKLTLVGVFQNMLVQQLPVSLIKFAVVNHWRGEGRYLSEVRILSPDKKQAVVVSEPAPFEMAQGGGHSDNVSFFVNVTFHTPGEYWVQTLINSTLFDEQPLLIMDARTAQTTEAASEAIN